MTKCHGLKMQAADGKMRKPDVLELHFTVRADPARSLKGRYLVYSFKFKTGKWKKDHNDPFEGNVNEVLKGKIVGAFYKS